MTEIKNCLYLFLLIFEKISIFLVFSRLPGFDKKHFSKGMLSETFSVNEFNLAVYMLFHAMQKQRIILN